MNKKTIKIVSIVLVALIVMLSISSSVFALSAGDLTGGKVDTSTETTVKNVANKIIGAMRLVGTAAAVIILMILGFKYLMGSAEDKADYKKSMIPYIVGAICIFLAPWIAGAILGFVQDANASTKDEKDEKDGSTAIVAMIDQQ
ncbi:MAG: TrbC/VirB2 family protein [Clostridia bacterium]|nr:TrbC/VirB2 family protein [Clostridia bacterium]